MPTPNEEVLLTTDSMEQMFEFFRELDKKTSEVKQKDLKDVKSALRVIPSNDFTFVVVLAINPDYSKNNLMRINCNHGNPIGGYVYDSVSDCFTVRCADYSVLGLVNVAFKLSMDAAEGWNVYVPIPEPVLKRHFNSEQSSALKRFKETYQGHQYKFVQIITSV
jgi:hypothetical protein